MKYEFSALKPRNSLPRLAMINSIAGYGRCSSTIALPVISIMQVQVCPIPTKILSNHLGFPICHYTDYTPYVRDYLRAWEQLQLDFDGLYCGFLGNLELIDAAETFLRHFKPKTFLLDPVMGDHGKAYSTITDEYCHSLRALLPYAHILTPNLTEACLLTDTPYRNDAEWTSEELHLLCLRLSDLCPGRIVITGLECSDKITNLIWENQQLSSYSVPSAGAPHHGTGDLFSSILAADAMHGINFTASIKKAADFVALCINESERMNIPECDGVIFEKFLGRLL